MAEATVESIEKYGLRKKDKPKILFSKIGIVGCGSEGQSIARLISSSGMEVVFVETGNKAIETAMNGIEAELDAQIDHWGMTEGEKKAIVSRIHGSTSYTDLKDCDLIIESITSKNRESTVEIRQNVFKEIEKHVSKEAIIATNSTTLLITELSSELEYRDRCISLHFITNAPDSRIVEVVRGVDTSDEVYNDVCKFIKLLGKQVVPVTESPGLISVRMFAPIINEACDVLMEGVGTLDDIDQTMKTGMGLTLGPFELSDKVGLDQVLRWMDNLYQEFGNIKYKASPLIKRKVRANHLGRKTGRGFYEYDKEGNKSVSK